MKFIKPLIAAAAMTVAVSASATLVLPGSEQSLQSVLNSLYSCATCSDVSNAPDVNNDQVMPDELWAIEASGVATATLIIEIAGNAGSNVLGIYDSLNGNQTVLFSGAADQGDKAILSLNASGQLTIIYLNNNAFAGVALGSLSSNQFGFFLSTPNGTLFSEKAKNPNGDDQLVAFQGDGDTIQLPGQSAGVWGSSSFILAWEDIAYAGSDKDFNDFVFYVESVTNVPEPMMLGLLGLGLLGFGFSSRRKQQR